MPAVRALSGTAPHAAPSRGHGRAAPSRGSHRHRTGLGASQSETVTPYPRRPAPDFAAKPPSSPMICASSNRSTPRGHRFPRGALGQGMGYDLYHRFQPLIRYQVTDEVTVFVGRCPCGSVFQRIAHPQGRLDDVSVYPDGLCIHPHVFRSVLRQHSAIIEYQVHQREDGAAIQFVVDRPLDRARRQQTRTRVGRCRTRPPAGDPDGGDRPGSAGLGQAQTIPSPTPTVTATDSSWSNPIPHRRPPSAMSRDSLPKPVRAIGTG